MNFTSPVLNDFSSVEPELPPKEILRAIAVVFLSILALLVAMLSLLVAISLVFLVIAALLSAMASAFLPILSVLSAMLALFSAT